MKRYQTEFKLEVVKSFLAGEGGAKLLARRWSLPEEKIRSWVSHYRLHGIGLRPKRSVYSAQFKLQVLSHQDREQLSSRQVAAVYDIRNPNQVVVWRRKLDEGGVEALGCWRHPEADPWRVSDRLLPALQVGGLELAELALDQTTRAIEQHAERQATAAVAKLATEAEATRAGQPDGKGQRMPLQEGTHRAGLIDRQAQHLPALGALLALERIEQRQFLDARRTPGGPEIQQQRPAAQLRHRDAGALRRLPLQPPHGFERRIAHGSGARSPPGDPGASQRCGGRDADRHGSAPSHACASRAIRARSALASPRGLRPSASGNSEPRWPL